MIVDLFQPEDLELVAHLAAEDKKGLLVHRLEEAHHHLAVKACNLDGPQMHKTQGAALFAKALADEIREAHSNMKKHRAKETPR